jgi:hypothetical protein
MKKWYAGIMFAIMLFVFFYYQQNGILQHDVVETAQYAEYVVTNEHDTLYEKYLVTKYPWRTGTLLLTAGMYYLMHFFSISSECTAFFTQFLFGSLAVVFLYLFLREMYNDTAAFFTALAFGLSAPLFNAVLSKDHGTEFFFACAAMYFLIYGLKNKNLLSLCISNIALGLTLWMREAMLLFPVIYYGFLVVYAYKNKIQEIYSAKNMFALSIPYIFLTAGALYVYVWMMITNASQNLAVPLFTNTGKILQSLWQWYPLLLLFAGIGIILAVKQKEYLVLFFTSIAVLFFIFFTKNATYDIRHLGMYVLFPLSVIECFVFSLLLEKYNDWKKYCIICIVVFVCIAGFIPGVSLFEQRKEHVYTKEFAQNIATIVPENGIIIIQKDFCLFFSYYAKRECIGLPDNFMATVDNYILSGKRVFVAYHAGFGFYDDETKNAIEQTYQLIPVYTGNFETFHHADLKPQVYEEYLIEVKHR